VKDYTHSTAPNRRYSDLITHRLIKAALTGATAPYSPDELTELARHCTRQEDEANKVERRVNKAAAALLLAQRIGESFPAIVTGAAPKGTWIKLTAIPVEGRLVEGSNGVDVGDRLTVRLSRADIEQGHLDFCRNA